jgi:hypothetical protein
VALPARADIGSDENATLILHRAETSVPTELVT